MKAMILAAGLGKRLRPLTETTPKPLLKVGGKPLIQYHVERLALAGITELVINTFWLGNQIESFLGDGSGFGVDITWSREEQILETGGGIFHALDKCGSEPFLVINGDIWTDYPLENLAQKSWPKSTYAHLVLVPNPAHNSDGDFVLNQNQTIGYACSNNSADEQSYTFSGLSVLRPELFTQYVRRDKKFPLREVIAVGINCGHVTGEVFHQHWWDIGTTERLDALNAQLDKI